MQTRNMLLRISRFLGKAIAGLLLLFVAAVILLHIPFIQKQLTSSASNYLSDKINARVEIQRIHFSILGNIEIEGLDVWDPGKIKIFSAENVNVSSSLVDLILGDLIFDEIHLSGIEGHLSQEEDGLNIQFIIDAFQTEKTDAPEKSSEVNIQFNKVYLENTLFEFNSTVSGTKVGVDLGTLMVQGAQLLTNPIRIIAEKVNLSNTTVNVLSKARQDTAIHYAASETSNLLSPDFGTGIIFEVTELDFADNDFSFHQNEVINTQKFDPSHLSLKNIKFHLSDIIIHKDTLAASLKNLSTNLPGFHLTNAAAVIGMSRNLFAVSGLHLASGSNRLQAGLTGPLDLNAAKEENHAPVDISVQATINPAELSYFFSDTVMNHFSNWETTDVGLEGHYALRKGEIKTLNLKTGNNQINAEGIINDVLDNEKINWKDVRINAVMGSAFRQTLAPFVGKVTLPPDATILLSTSGNPKKMSVNGNVATTWGNIKAIGLASQQATNLKFDMNLTGEKVDVGKWVNLSWIGPLDLTAGAKGVVGTNPDIEVKGLVSSVVILDQPIHKIDFQGMVRKTNASATLSIADPKYRLDISSEFSFDEPLTLNTVVHLDSFSVGRLLHLDSTLRISGLFKSNVQIDQASLDGYVTGQHLLIQNQTKEYPLDTLAIHAMISPTTSSLGYFTDDGKANVTSNFDIRDVAEVIRAWPANLFRNTDHKVLAEGNRTVQFDIQLKNALPFQLMGIDVENFSSLSARGALDEKTQTLDLQATSGNFKGYGISLDTLSTTISALNDSINAVMDTENLFYKTTELGKLKVDMFAKGDTTNAALLLTRDSLTLLGFRTRLLPTDSGLFIYPDELTLLDYDYSLDRKNPLYIEKENKNIVLDHFLITQRDMQVSIDGDLHAFDIILKNADLTRLNYLLSRDTTIINKGRLNGTISYSQDQHLNLNASIDSLSLYNSNPLSVTITALRNKNQVPFEFHVTNASNKIDLNGEYGIDKSEVDASLLLDVQNLELFAFLLTGVFEDMNGILKGEIAIRGPIQAPGLNGKVRISDASFNTVNPKLTFHVKDDVITMDNSSFLLNDFKLYDEKNNPLTINGKITSDDYESVAYDLHITSDQYTLLNRPDSKTGQLRGILVIGTDIKLTGKENDTQVEAKIIVKDATALSYVASSDDIELLKSEGIVDFIDPALLLETQGGGASSYYDSLIASLPDFNLNSTVTIEDNASIRIIINEQSGDFIEASGGANLELGYDRTGNFRLSGNYTIKKGVYRLSFYDLVKKNFTLAPGSSITWNGSPENGDLAIKAVYTVSSNSIGLIGHEIGENEKSIYKRTLDYQVGININGTIENPLISFSLDLPQVEKTNYPVLANKLDRLRQPEYASELNKQVFGLLVLGGFLPETSGADINQNLIATTALSNSVNSLLASQLNRFASQYVKGVNIDVGIQSYSDYSAPGGKTRTAMDFRVSKRVMNDRLSFEVGGDFDINQDQSGSNTGNNFRGDVAIIYDLTSNGDKQLKVFNNETYDIIYQEIRNTGISLVFIREFDRDKKNNSQAK